MYQEVRSQALLVFPPVLQLPGDRKKGVFSSKQCSCTSPYMKLLIAKRNSPLLLLFVCAGVIVTARAALAWAGVAVNTSAYFEWHIPPGFS